MRALLAIASDPQGGSVGLMHAAPRHAFTLIELLIAIAVVAALGGLLIPAATSVHAHARSVACRSNLRQVGMAALAYAGDHQDRLPATRNWGDDDPATSPAWFHRLPSYVGQRDLKKGLSIFQCAAFRWREPIVFTNASPKSFKCNAALEDAGRPRHYRLGSFTQEHEFVLFIDGVAKETGMGQWGHCPPQAVDGSRHRGEANLLALDGHSLRAVKRTGNEWTPALRWLP